MPRPDANTARRKNSTTFGDILPRWPNGAVAAVCASLGWRVFPLDDRRGKLKPAIKNWPNEATTSRDQIDEWWLVWPERPVGLATGAASGVWVLDVDVKKVNGFASLRDVMHRHGVTDVPDTFRVRTPSGGQHWYFQYPDDGRDIKNTASKLGPGVDSRGRGGYVVAPASWTLRGTYEVIDDRVVVPAWRWLEDALERPTYDTPSLPPGDTVRYARGVLEHAADRLAAMASDSGRNDGLNRAAFQLGRLGALGVVSRDDALATLMDACTTNGLIADDGEDACRATFESGWNAGRCNA